jgi:hypothetical protein
VLAFIFLSRESGNAQSSKKDTHNQHRENRTLAASFKKAQRHMIFVASRSAHQALGLARGNRTLLRLAPLREK